MILRIRFSAWALCLVALFGTVLFLWNHGDAEGAVALTPQQKTERSGEQTGAAHLIGPLAQGDSPDAREVRAPAIPEGAATVTRSATGRLEGQVTLLNGEPLANVHVEAKQAIPGGVEGAFIAKEQTNEAGSFRFSYLPEGTYELTVSSHWDLPVQNSRQHRTDGEPVVLAVDAVVVRAQIKAPFSELLHVSYIDCSRYDPNAPAQSRFSSQGEKTTLSSESEEARASLDRYHEYIESSILKESVEGYPIESVIGEWIQHANFVLPTTASFSFRSELRFDSHNAASQETYYGVLHSGQPSGTTTLELSTTPEDLGSLVIGIKEVALPKSARLQLVWMKHDGQDLFPLDHSTSTPRSGGTQLSFHGLTPGLYEVQVRLSNGGILMLKETTFEAFISGHMTTEHILKTTLWTRLQVSAKSLATVPPETFAKMKIKKPGSSTWQTMLLHTRGMSSGFSTTYLKSAVQVGGPPGVSDPIPPGTYSIQLSLPGHQLLEKTIELDTGEINVVTLELQPE